MPRLKKSVENSKPSMTKLIAMQLGRAPTLLASCWKTKPCAIGGTLLVLLLFALLLMGCQTTRVVGKCPVDQSLLVQLETPQMPVQPTNGNMAEDLRRTIDAIKKDNAAKHRLAAQLEKCQ